MRDTLRSVPGSHTVQWRFAPRRAPGREPEPVNHDNMVGLLVAASGALGLGAAILLPSSLILPAVALVALLGAAAIATFAYWRGAPASTSPRLSAWDVAGVLALIGFGAGMISDSAQLIELFGVTPTSF